MALILKLPIAELNAKFTQFIRDALRIVMVGFNNRCSALSMQMLANL